jgi:metal iron transporter
MPHALFLGSSLAGIDRLDMIPRLPTDSTTKKSFKMPTLGLIRRLRRKTGAVGVEEETIEMEPTPTPLDTGSQADMAGEMQDAESKPDILQRSGTKETDHEAAMKKYEADLKSFDRIRWTDLHIAHATVCSRCLSTLLHTDIQADTVISLLGIALTINASILTLAGAAFYYQNSDIDPANADIFGAHALIKSYIGNAAAVIFALALLCVSTLHSYHVIDRDQV